MKREITDRLRQEIREKLISLGRKCPRCEASPDLFEVTEVDDDVLHPDAAGPDGIDTSNTCDMAKIRCTKCDNRAMILPLQDVGLSAYGLSPLRRSGGEAKRG
jgi:hypothetical protein